MHSSTPIQIENDLLLIRNLGEQDLDGLIALRNDLKIYRYEPTYLMELQGTPEEALETIMNMDLFQDRQCILGIFRKTEPSVLVGLAEFYDFKPSGKVISIGARFLSAYWGAGLATSCAHAMIDFIKKNTEVEMITAHVIPGNKASSQVLLKNGFEYLMTKPENWGHEESDLAEVYTYDC